MTVDYNTNNDNRCDNENDADIFPSLICLHVDQLHSLCFTSMCSIKSVFS